MSEENETHGSEQDRPNTSVKTTKKAASNKQWIIENAISLFIAVFLVFAFRSSIVEAFKIPSGSMIPTLFIGDHIFVNKFAYSFRIPFTDYLMDKPIDIVKRDPPKRGDVVVFKYPKDESLYYIKRVIGTPGDMIEIKGDSLYVNDKEMKREPMEPALATKYLKELDDPEYSPEQNTVEYENLDGVKHMVLFVKEFPFQDEFGPIEVPAGKIFVMGDNRDHSNDSRFWGFVPFENVRGKAMFVWFSAWLNLFGEGSEKNAFNPQRIGTLVR